MVAHKCNSSTQELEEDRSLQIQGQPGLHRETLSQEKTMLKLWAKIEKMRIHYRSLC